MLRLILMLNPCSLSVYAFLLALSIQSELRTSQDLEALQGVWLLLTSESSGAGTNEDFNRNIEARLIIRGSRLTWSCTSDKHTLDFKIDANQSPKSLDISLKGTLHNKCIYELKNNDLRISIGPFFAERPKEFTGKGVAPLLTLRRAKL
jgi:uncharacterized protein (TIGR03067 family)